MTGGTCGIVGAARQGGDCRLISRVVRRAEGAGGSDHLLNDLVACDRGRTVERFAEPSGEGWPTCMSPVVDIIEVSERTRPECSIAMVCAIAPPKDAPTTWAFANAQLGFAMRWSIAVSRSPGGRRGTLGQQRFKDVLIGPPYH
ncbi:MAG TPA: hypothetical protein VKB88_19555 [Bryobacteraceae bacterium]|nr:hypothetical protein [Bryobacteraceae bacterium]